MLSKGGHINASRKGLPRNSLANTAILLQLLHGLIETKILPSEKALALLGNSADELVTYGKQVTDVHILAADSIRKELVPKV